MESQQKPEIGEVDQTSQKEEEMAYTEHNEISSSHSEE
jgi:hypothetical protein